VIYFVSYSSDQANLGLPLYGKNTSIFFKSCIQVMEYLPDWWLVKGKGKCFPVHAMKAHTASEEIPGHEWLPGTSVGGG
jgi:hypothetical protein